MKRCPNCKAEDIDEDLAGLGFCSECGEELDPDEAEVDEEDDDEDDDDHDETEEDEG